MSYKLRLNLLAIGIEVRVAFHRPLAEPIDITQSEYKPCIGRHVKIKLPKDMDSVSTRDLRWLEKRLFTKEIFRNISVYYSAGEECYVLSFFIGGGMREKYYEKED